MEGENRVSFEMTSGGISFKPRVLLMADVAAFPLNRVFFCYRRNSVFLLNRIVVEGGRWKVEGGKWKVKGGRWKVEGKWKVEGGRWKV